MTTSHDEERAMYLLRNHWDKFDIAIMEAHTLEGKIFRLISENESEIDIPIISKHIILKSVYIEFFDKKT